MTEPFFSVIHATRGRSLQALETRKQWLGCAADPSGIEYVLAVDSDDTDTIGCIPSSVPFIRVDQNGIRRGCTHAFNAAAAASHGDVIVEGSDDYYPCKDWDRLIRDEIKEISPKLHPFVLRFRNPLAPPGYPFHPTAITRARYDQNGFFSFPGYFSVYADTENIWRAKMEGVLKECRSVLIEHRHPILYRSVKWDATYIDQNASEHYIRGKRLFMDRNPGANL